MTPSLIVFQGTKRIATGPLAEIAPSLRDAGDGLLALDTRTGRIVDLDLSGSASDIAERYAPPPAEAEAPRGRGRPKLGVTAREVTLLPRQWEWLATQPGGTSAALRRLIDAARRVSEGEDRRRAAQDATYHAMQALAGDLPGYEEALRALFAADAAGFAERTAPWPEDLRDFFSDLAARALSAAAGTDIPPAECD